MRRPHAVADAHGNGNTGGVGQGGEQLAADVGSRIGQQGDSITLGRPVAQHPRKVHQPESRMLGSPVALGVDLASRAGAVGAEPLGLEEHRHLVHHFRVAAQ